MQAAAISGELNALNHVERKVAESGWSAGEREERLDRIDIRMRELNSMILDLAAAKVAGQSVRSAPPPVAETRTGLESPEYRAAFWKYLATRNDSEVRAISNSTTNIGVPADMYRTIIERLYAPTTLLGRIPRVSVDGDKKIAIGNALPTVEFLDEADPSTPSDPTFSAQITVDPKTIRAHTRASVESLRDAVGNPSMQGFITKMQTIAMQIHLEKAIVQGGVTKAWTNGLMIAPHNSSQKVAGGAKYININGDNLIDMVHAVKPQYRTGNFLIVLDDDALKNIRKIKVNTTDYVWKVSETGGIKDGIPGTIYGIPYIVTQQIDQTAINTGNKSRILCGNFDYCTLFERQGMEMFVDPYSSSANLQVNMYTFGRYDFHVTVPEAFSGITFTSAE